MLSVGIKQSAVFSCSFFTMNLSKTISKKLRFEVFKRDKFKCQYCGRSAPDVVLEVDHINPKSKGGERDILNLITSCFDCNRGKKNRLLNDNTILEKQREQLCLLSEKQNQLKMMIEWRKELSKIGENALRGLLKIWEENTQYTLNESGTNSIKILLKNYSFTEISSAMDIVMKYLKYEENKPTRESVEYAFNKIRGICYIKSLSEGQQKAYMKRGYILGIFKNKFNTTFYDEIKLRRTLDFYVKNSDIEALEIIESILKDSCNKNNFFKEINNAQ